MIIKSEQFGSPWSFSALQYSHSPLFPTNRLTSTVQPIYHGGGVLTEALVGPLDTVLELPQQRVRHLVRHRLKDQEHRRQQLNVTSSLSLRHQQFGKGPYGKGP